MNILKNQVAEVMEEIAATRNSDKLLTVHVLKKYYGVEIIEDILDPAVPPFESISRHRRRLQEEGKFTADKEVKSMRKEMESQYRELYCNK